MDGKQSKAFIEWYDVLFKKFVAPKMGASGFDAESVSQWGYSLFRRPFVKVLEAVGRKAQKDTEAFLAAVALPAVAVSVFTLVATPSPLGVSVAGFVSLVLSLAMCWTVMHLYRSSFDRDGVDYCTVGRKVYCDRFDDFLSRYMPYAVMFAIAESGRQGMTLKGSGDEDSFFDFIGKLVSFGGGGGTNGKTEEKDRR